MIITTEVNDIKERLSVAYVTAIAARAGCQITKLDIDKQSIDATIRPISGRKISIDLQLKATSTNCFDGDSVLYDLPVKNYDDLRDTQCTSPHYLVILALDEEDEFWLLHDEESLAITRCAYWHSLRGLGPTPNSSTFRIRFPKTQMFNVNTLTQMMSDAFHAASLNSGGA